MNEHSCPHRFLAAAILLTFCLSAAAQTPTPATGPTKVYVPYEQLKQVFEKEKQGVFLPYAEFQRLWQAAQGTPAGVGQAPVPYLVSTARFSGKVGQELATMQLELTVDILQDGWVEVPIGLGDVAVAKAEFAAPADSKVQPLLRVVDGKYVLLTKGAGRRVLKVDFVRQLVTQPGLNVLNFRIPSAAVSTLDLLIPEENMKVDVEPMLAASTTQVEQDGKKSTKLQAFLGAADSVKLSWKPRTQAAEELEPVVILEQFQHINVGEALISYDIRFDLDIRRRGLDAFTIQLPADYRVISVDGANIAKWDMNPPNPEPGKPQNLLVKLFSPAKDKYSLTVKMERFLKEPAVQIPLAPAIVQQALRGTGLIALTHSAGRSVELKDLKNLARVDAGRLPENLRAMPGATAWRFITADYGATMDIATVEPRITLQQLWAIGVQSDSVQLLARLNYNVERSGVFQVAMNVPDGWEVVGVTPVAIVDDHQFAGKGPGRMLNILLKKETLGAFSVDVALRRSRTEGEPLDFSVLLPDAKNLQAFSGEAVLYLPDQLRAEVEKQEQLIPLPLGNAHQWTGLPGTAAAMAFEFKTIDRAKPAEAKFKIAAKPTQVSAVVNRLVNIQQGAVEQEAVVQFRVMYAPIDTFYLKMPAALANAGAQITGSDIKEKPRIDSLPADQRQGDGATSAPAATAPSDGGKWAYFKIVLQSPVIGNYTLTVRLRQPFQQAKPGQETTVEVPPILAAGRISDQSGYVAVAKQDTLAILTPTFKNLIPADPTSATDLPYEPHRRVASLAFKYNAPPFELSLPVLSQQEAAVITTIASAAIIEQVVARDGKSNARAAFLLSTSRGDRMAVTLPAGAQLLGGILVNGAEAGVEKGAAANEYIVRLPPSAGQVSKVVMEVQYQLEKATLSSLASPSLPKEVPVQQTLWRLWVPSEDYVLRYDRTFSMLDSYEASQMVGQLAAGQPTAVTLKLDGQGQQLFFLRQGRPETLSVTTMSREAFSILIWLLILGVGCVMLPLRGYARAKIVLAAALATLVLSLFAPLLARRIANVGCWAAAIVALLWLAQWLFIRCPRRAKPAASATPVTGTESAPRRQGGKE